jgi:hypothetical protein
VAKGFDWQERRFEVKVVQVVKKLNNTELGKGGTHDSYVLVPSELDITDVFVKLNAPVTFIDKNTVEQIVIKSTYGRERRIVGLGQYYRNHDLSAGDEIMFERREIGARAEHFVCVKKQEDVLSFQKSKSGFEILTPERVERFQKLADDAGLALELRFLTSKKKRKDSPDSTDYYDVFFSGKSLADVVSGNSLVEMGIRGGEIVTNLFYGWKKYVFETEEST